MLVAAQFVLFAVLLLPCERRGWFMTGLAGVVLGLAWMGWTMTANRPGNFNVRPEPKPGSRLATHGPYRLMRHPMYFGVLLSFFGCLIVWPAWWKLAAWLALVVLLIVKAHREETGLRKQFPEYAEYARGRRFLVPWLW